MASHLFPSQAFSIALLAAGLSASASAQSYTVSNLDSDVPGAAANVDPQLVAPIGLARGILGPWWVSDEGSALSTLYGGDGGKRGLVVKLPSPPGSSTPSRPTGTSFSGSPTEFNVSPGNPANFLFVTLEGTILGWPGADVFDAAILVDNQGEASYTGMTIAEVGNGHRLYAVDSRRGRIEAYDGSLNPVALDDDAFRDERLPDGLIPFNVQQLGSDVVVTYRRRSDDFGEGRVRGWVSIFDARGRFLARLDGRGLDAPWGVTIAPHDFGEFSHRLLVANHGSGDIAAFDLFTGRFAGKMLDPTGLPIHIDGLWAISFGDGGIANFASGGPNTGPYNACYFTAAPQDGQHGLFGNLVPVMAEQTHDEQ